MAMSAFDDKALKSDLVIPRAIGIELFDWLCDFGINLKEVWRY